MDAIQLELPSRKRFIKNRSVVIHSQNKLGSPNNNKGNNKLRES